MTDVYGRVSGEQLANTTLTGNQSEPRTIGLEGGGYVVVWTDLQGTTNQECRGQVFDNDGNKVGGEFLINTDTTGNEFQPKVAALEGGGFVVSFTDSNGDGAGNTGIRLQMFDATGNKVGGEFSANATATGNQTLSSVAGLPGGGFVALWMDANNSGDVVARIFDSAGVGGAEFVVNTNVINSQRDAVATALSDGNFVVTWTDSASSDVRAQIMTAAGTKVGGEFAVATNTTGSQGVPSITALKDGGFVVTWEDYSGVGDTSQSGIKGQVFNDSGTRVGSEFVVNATTYYFQQTPSVAALESGGFVVTWLDRSGIGGDTQDSGSNAVKAQVFNADGTRDGIEFLVNTTTAQNQWLPTVAGLTNGGFAISWVDASATLDNTGYGVVTQVFAPSDGSISDIALTNATVAEAQAENSIVGTLSANGPVTVARELTYTIVSDSTGGAFGIKDDKLVVADNARLDFETAPSATITIEVRDADGNSYQETFSIGVTDVASEVRWHAGNDIAVNTTTGGDQWLQAMAALDGGGYVVTWTDASATGGDTTGQAIRGQRFDDHGNKVGGEFLVNTTTTGNQTASSVVATADGGFLVVWQDAGSTPAAIRGQFFEADGAKLGAEFRIDDAVGGASLPEITRLNSGNFIVVWADASGDAGTTAAGGIRGQVIDATGAKVGSEFTLNTQINNTQGDPAIATTATGFVAVWTDANGQGVIRAQFFDNNGGFIGGEFQVNTQTAMNQVKPTATVLANGDVLFTWWDLSNVGGDTQNGGIKGQLYTSAGVRIGGEFLMNTTVDRDQDAPRVTALADGGFVLVFEDRSEYLLGNIRAQQFDAAGNKVGGEWIANYDISYAQKVPTIVQLENGDLAIAWYSGKNIGGDPLGWDVMTRVVSPAVAGTDPVANADSLSAATDVATTFAAADLLGNDTHSFGTLSIQSVTAGTGGTVVLNSDGSVTFTSSAGFEGDAAFTYVVTDGEGGTSSATVTVDVAIPDLTPVHSGLPSTIYTAEDEPVGLNGGFAIDPPPSWISDSDSATITTTLTAASGSFSITRPGGADITGDGTGTVTITGTVADVNAAVYFASYNPAPDVYGTREITVTTSDAHSSASNTIQVEIAPMHDAPAGADVTVTATEDTPYILRALDFGFSDIDGNSLAYVLLTSTPVHGRIVDLGGYVVEEDIDGDGDADLLYSAPERELGAGDILDPSLMALGYIVYIPAANANGPAADSFTYQVVDNGDVPGSAGTVDLTPNTLTFDITEVNDVPNLTGLATTITVSENTTALIDTDVTFTDPEGNFDGGTLTVSGLLADDTVSFQDQGTGPGQIGASGGDVTYEGVVIGAWSGGAGGTFTVTFNAAATSAAIDALIESLSFGNTSDTPVASRDLTVTVTDDLGESISRTVTVDVTAVNDAPVNTVPADGAITGYAYTPIAITGLAVTDVDAAPGAIITVSILAGSGTLHVAEGVAGGGSVFGNDSALVVLSGTLSEVNATLSALDGVTLTSGAGTINVTLTANDGGSSGVDPGTGSASSEEDADTFTVEVLNHTPTVTIGTDYPAAGVETQVNTFTSGLQFQPDVAALEGGGYVVTWTSANQDGSSYGIYSQRFDDAGTALGGEVRVNSMVSGGQQQPAVAALADGGYVVTWTSENGDGSGSGIFAQRYDAAGTPLGSETQINVTSSLDQTGPSVTGLADGSFVVTWQSNLQDGSGFGIYARRFDAGGNAMTGEALVNTATGDNQMYPAVTGLAGGGYVVTWQSYNQDGSDWGLYAQRYDSAGDPAGGEVRVSTTTLGDQTTPSVTALADGGYVVTWASADDGSGWGIYSQRYDSDGNSAGGETLVNTTTVSDQMTASVSALTDGGYVVTWTSSGQDGSGTGVYSQRFDSDGNAVGSEARVNTTTAGDQDSPVVAGLAHGGYAVVWTSFAQDGSQFGVFTQSFADPLSAVEQVALDLKGTIAVADSDAPDILTVTLSVDFGVLDVTAGTSGATVTDSGTSTVTITGTAAQIQALLDSDATSTVSFTADDDAPPASANLTVTVDDGTDQATASHTIAITAVNDAPDIELDYFEPPVTSWTEGDGPVALTHGAIFDDDNDDFDGAVLTVSLGGATSGDQLTIETGFGLEISGNDLIYDDPVDGPTVVGTLSGGDDGNPLTITFNEEACHCAVELAMASIQYDNTDHLTVPSTRTVEVTLVDGGGTALGGSDTGSDSFILDVLPEAQVVTGAAAVGDEDTPIALTGVVIDSLAADPASDVVVVTLHVEHGTLDIRDDVSGGLAAGAIAGDGTDTLVLTGTQDAINATLAASGGLTYQGDADFFGADALAIEAHLDAPSVPFSFTSMGGLPGGVPVIALDVVDLDRDGTDELIFGVPGALAILGSSGSGVLPLPDSGAPLDFAFGDVDGDGMTDVVFSVGGGLGLDNYLAFYSSAINDFVPIAEVGGGYDLALGDFDGDGLLDFAVADVDAAGVTLVLQDGLGGFEAPVTVTTGHQAYSLVAADFNGDNVLDLLVANLAALPGQTGPGSVDLLLGNGDGSFAPAAGVAAPAAFVGEVIAADFNGDGALDFAFAYATDPAGGAGGVQVALGNGDGTFAAAVAYETTTTGTPVRLLAADLNGDGLLDLAVANQDVPGSFSVLGGNGDGTFDAPVAFDTYEGPFEIAAGDPDDDGDLDIIIAALEAGGVIDFLNNDTDAVFHQITGSKDITVNPVEDDAVAVDDPATVAADDLVTIAVLVNDSDVDGPAPLIATVNGVTLTAGQTTTLASGAVVGLLADGTLTYDPDGNFDWLVSPATALATGASNGSATDVFTYTLAGGASATVTVTVLGVDEPGDELLGTPAGDTITGTAGNDLIRAFGDVDLISGGEGNDTIWGNDDGDTLVGDAGNDRLYGGNGDDLVQGGEGDDVLIGNLGDDTLVGGLGDDLYYVGRADDVVVENLNEGFDTVRAQIDYTLTDNVEELFIGGAARNGTGNALDNVLHGSDSSNTLSGLDGADVLRGSGGRDALLGGNGADLIDGGIGKDTLAGGTGRDVFQFRDGDMGASRPLADLITDFSQADHEKIQLSLVDADTAIAGNQAFAFVGTAAFSGTAGELRYEHALGNTWVSADVDGDGAADWYIGLTGTHTLVSGDFTL